MAEGQGSSSAVNETGDQLSPPNKTNDLVAGAEVETQVPPRDTSKNDQLHLKWKVSTTPVLIDILSPTAAVVIDDRAYIRKFHGRRVYMYEKGSWSRLGGNNCQHPDRDETRCRNCKCPTRDNTLVSIRSDLYTVGGLEIPRTELESKGKPALTREDIIKGKMYEEEEFSDKIYKWNGEKWEECKDFPHMNFARKQVIAICHGDYLIVAGGRTKDGPTKIVEVFNTRTKQWSRASDLPKAVYRGSVCICNGFLYILGCFAMVDHGQKPVKYACRVLLTDLQENLRESYDQPPMVFQEICELQHELSVCVSFDDRVLALGGVCIDQAKSHIEPTSVRNVYQFKEADTQNRNGSWRPVNDPMIIRRCLHFAAVFGSGDSSKLMVVGGCPFRSDSHCIDLVEFGELRNAQE